MKVLLLDAVHGVGKKGEMHEVKEGFGRNYLIPRGLALPATKGNVNKIAEQAKVIIQRRERDVQSAGELKEKLEQGSVSIKKKVGLDGKLFGSVTSKEVAEAIKKNFGMDVDRKGIKLDESIKMTGAYTAEVHLGTGVNAQVKLEVEAE
jgi:large subunit ribosomal protein L9